MLRKWFWLAVYWEEYFPLDSALFLLKGLFQYSSFWCYKFFLDVTLITHSICSEKIMLKHRFNLSVWETVSKLSGLAQHSCLTVVLFVLDIGPHPIITADEKNTDCYLQVCSWRSENVKVLVPFAYNINRCKNHILQCVIVFSPIQPTIEAFFVIFLLLKGMRHNILAVVILHVAQINRVAIFTAVYFKIDKAYRKNSIWLINIYPTN